MKKNSKIEILDAHSFNNVSKFSDFYLPILNSYSERMFIKNLHIFLLFTS